MDITAEFEALISSAWRTRQLAAMAVSKCGSYRGRPGQVHAHEIRCHRCARAYAGRYSGR